MNGETENRRVYWHSRRGMLELDIVLMPFAAEVYPGLPDDLKRKYKKLLACEDTDLFSWFLQHSQPQDRELSEIVEFVLSHHHTDSDRT